MTDTAAVNLLVYSNPQWRDTSKENSNGTAPGTVFANRLPTIPDSPELRLAGDVKRADQIALTELAALPRVAQVADFHCVTSWSTLGLRREGVRCVDFLEWAYPRLDPDPDIR